MPKLGLALKLALVATLLLGQYGCGNKQVISTQPSSPASKQAPSVNTSSTTNGQKAVAAPYVVVNRMAIAYGSIATTQAAYSKQQGKPADGATALSNDEIAMLLNNLRAAYQAQLKTAAYQHKLVISRYSRQVPLLSIQFTNFSKTCAKAGNCLYALDMRYSLQLPNGQTLWQGTHKLRDIAQLRNQGLYNTLGQYGVSALLSELRQDGVIN